VRECNRAVFEAEIEDEKKTTLLPSTASHIQMKLPMMMTQMKRTTMQTQIVSRKTGNLMHQASKA